MTFPQLRIIPNKRNELNIRPVFETYKLVLGLAIGVSTTGSDSKVFGYPRGQGEELSVWEEDDYVVEVAWHCGISAVIRVGKPDWNAFY